MTEYSDILVRERNEAWAERSALLEQNKKLQYAYDRLREEKKIADSVYVVAMADLKRESVLRDRDEQVTAQLRREVRGLREELSAAKSFCAKYVTERDNALRDTYMMRGELAAAQKDAERYRWLRTHPLTLNDGNYVVWKPDTLDESIDAAMGEQK